MSDELKRFNKWLDSDEGKNALKRYWEEFAQFAKDWKPVLPQEAFDGAASIVTVKLLSGYEALQPEDAGDQWEELDAAIRAAIRQWNFYWLNQSDYKDRVARIDANMAHHLADKIVEVVRQRFIKASS